MDSCFSRLPTHPLTSSSVPCGDCEVVRFSSRQEQNSLYIAIRAARNGDLHHLAEVLAKSFHPRHGWMSWAYSLLKLGIQEDLRNRLQEQSPHYLCLVALVSVRDSGLMGEKQDAAVGSEGQSPQKTVGHLGEIAGTVEITLRSSSAIARTQYAYISNLAVSQSYRRQGIARKLLLNCEPMARDWGMREIYLHVLEDNQRARQLYSSSGYRLHRVESSWDSVLFNRPRRLLLQKTLERCSSQ
ncbi:MAG: GNAT family N-acetyltransferase [Cyanobacteriota bacterium]|nr:GNAT family N-acetyltransferase [Cyanobacteriota bacterium]